MVQAKKENKKTKGVKEELPKNDKFAVIKTGGKQYLVKEGQKIRIEKLAGKEKDKIEFPEVLLTFSQTTAEIGNPLVKDAKVSGSIIAQGRGKKITVFKMKAKKRYRKTQGHRQDYTEVLIEKI